ncbi:LamG-like jellyroll fold domain-containing protein [Luteolibacter soli]|uniref:LamG-like jellyroll fold domain-containing protein n=1 Tax=Luteolibacter soli TaxID=3135280 RepID=A0ABU9AZV8_9BACT
MLAISPKAGVAGLCPRVGYWPFVAAMALSGLTPVQALTWHFGYVYNDDQAKKDQITAVMNEAVAVYNASTNFNVDINVAYHPGVPTAESNYNGELKFGGSISTQVAIHEIAHYLGSGTTNEWNDRFGGDNVWDGAMLKHFVKQYDGPGAEIYQSGVHYYPYGFNYGNEDSPQARRRLPRLIEAMRFDLGFISDGDGDGMSDEWENFKIGGMSQTATGDADGDGIANRDEWLTDGDPLRSAPVRNGHTYLIRSRLSQKLMEVAGMGAGANVRQNAPDGSDFQKWTATHVGGGYWKFLNVASGKALETGGLSNDPGANIMVWDDLGHDYQQWRVVPEGAANWKIINKGSRNKVVDVEGGPNALGNLVNISQYNDDIGANNQAWSFEDITAGEPTGALLQALYKLDGSVRDASSNELHGTASNVSYGAGRVDVQAAVFNGTNSSVQIPAAVDMTFSIAFWVKTTATAGTGQWYSGMGLVDGEVAGVATDFGLALVGNKIGFGVGNTDLTITSNNAVNDGQWHHVVATRDGTTGAMRINVDGVLRATGTGPTGPRLATGSLRLGSIGGVGGFFNGSLDEVRLYRGILSATEISRLANVSRTQVAGYGFENQVQDSSQHGHHGTASGITYVAGKTGTSAAQFDGTGSFVKIPAAPVTDFSVAYWVKTTATGGTGQWWAGKSMVDAEMPGAANDWGISLVGNKAGFGMGNPDQTILSTTAINDGTWHHITATRTNAGAMKLYVDGVLQASGAGPAAARTAAGFLRVGSSPFGGVFFAGTIDDLKIYNYAVDAGQAAALASPLPAPWASQDIGAPGSDGYAGFDGSTYSVAGAGSGIVGTSDQFHFLSSSQTGDRVLVTRLLTGAVNHDGTTSADAKAGLMFRSSAAANASFVALVHTQTKGLQFLHRDASGGAITQTGVDVAQGAACWLRLARAGNTFAASYATTPGAPTDGDWVPLGSHVAVLGATVPGGLAVSSQTPAKIATATFASLSSTLNAPPTLSVVSDQTIAENTSTAVLPVTVGDVESSAASLVFGASSSNATLVPPSGIVAGGSGANRTVTITPAGNQSGSAVITISVSDGGLPVTRSFTLTVTTTPGGGWRQQHFGSTLNSGNAADAADPDGDGIENLLERAFSLNPVVAGDRTKLPAFTREGAFLVLSYTKSVAASDLTFQVKWSNDLASWSTDGVTDSLISSDGATEFRAGRVPAAQVDPKRSFLRLMVTP